MFVFIFLPFYFVEFSLQNYISYLLTNKSNIFYDIQMAGEKNVRILRDLCEIEMGMKKRIYEVKSSKRSKVQTPKKQQ